MKFYAQTGMMDCGPACLMMICDHYGIKVTIEYIRQLISVGKAGTNLKNLAEGGESLGFTTFPAKLDFEALIEQDMPCILLWNKSHYVVFMGRRTFGNSLKIADPAKGIINLSLSEFKRFWYINGDEKKGIALLFSKPNVDKLITINSDSKSQRSLFSFFKPHKRLIIHVYFSLVIIALVQFAFPFLTQSIVDVGVMGRDISFIKLILLGQLILFAGRIASDFVRSWLLMSISAKVNLSILTLYVSKLLKLPISFFQGRITGDLLQRISDHKRIESFLTGQVLMVVYSLLILVIFNVILLIFSFKIFLIFIISFILYYFWIVAFLKRRRVLDYEQFGLSAQSQSNTLQLIQGIHEIKLYDCEKEKRWEWEELQSRLYSVHFRNLSLNQVQNIGALAINEGKNILITFYAASSVVSGDISLGAMLSIQYIIGQLNTPVESLIEFVKGYQNAKISLDRLLEVYDAKEEDEGKIKLTSFGNKFEKIQVSGLSFKYPGSDNLVLDNIDLEIPHGKITAIVGPSGSGKTTLLKLLLKFYKYGNGNILVGNSELNNIATKDWRKACGAVMQESFIFSDTILKNIIIKGSVNGERLQKAINAANIQSFVNELPLGMDTVIGQEGQSLSAGQKQRILIARAIYKNPDFIFFDEATNALDAVNEELVMFNLNKFFKKKTVVIVAHRLSTVKNADQIIVLSNHTVAEKGTHEELLAMKGLYHNLVSSQLQLEIIK